MITRTLPSLKAKPEWLPWTLKCILNHIGNYKEIQYCITKHWRDASIRKKPPLEKNAIRAVFGPTLRHLQLIMNEGDNIILTSKGKELLKTYENEGELSYKQFLAKHLIKFEKERWMPVISELRKIETPINENILLENLNFAYNVKISLDKLKKILLYYKYIGLVHFDHKNIVLHKKQLDLLIKDKEVSLTDEQFIQVLIESYDKLVSESQGSHYITLPSLREHVCEKTGIWPDDFYRMLRNIQKESPNYIIHLSQPMTRKPGGIYIGEKYLYYIAIYKKRRK